MCETHCSIDELILIAESITLSNMENIFNNMGLEGVHEFIQAVIHQRAAILKKGAAE